MADNLSIDNIVRVSLSPSRTLLQGLNPNDVAIITTETPEKAIPAGWKSYSVSALPLIAADFGADSKVYKAAQTLLPQGKNLLTAKGSIKIGFKTSADVDTPAIMPGLNVVNFSQLTGTDYRLKIDSTETADIDFSSATTTAAKIAAINTALTGYTVSEIDDSGRYQIKSTATGSAAKVEIQATGAGTDLAPIFGFEGSRSGLDANTAIVLRLNKLTGFLCFFTCQDVGSGMADLAQWAVDNKKLYLGWSSTAADLDTGGRFDTIKEKSLTFGFQPCFYSIASDAYLIAAGLAAQIALMDFGKINDISNPNLKTIQGLTPDSGVTQETYTKAKKLGVSLYVPYGNQESSIAGIADFRFGAHFASTKFSLIAFINEIQNAYFNRLRSERIITQTESGLELLKSTAEQICIKYRSFGFLAPGKWNSSEFFGNYENHVLEIAKEGFYVYMPELSLQSQVDREANLAPVTYVAVKGSGAVNEADILVNFEV